MQRISSDIATAGRLLLPSKCRRRGRALTPLACDILLARGQGRALAPAAWTSLLALVVLLPQTPQLGFILVPTLGLFAGLCLVALFDARYFVIPDGPILCLGAGALLTILLTEPQALLLRLAAAAVGFASLRLVAHAYEMLRGNAGVGEGDASLFAVAGLWLGFEGLPSCLVYAVLSGLVAAAVAIREGVLEHARQPIPFGPHLALGLWLAWTFGPLEFG